jgi:heterotetrameric sarcosine oxidase delta subunit
VIQLPCPNCGPRNSDEFAYYGERTPRPAAEDGPAAWRGYLYAKKNPAGWTTEQWFHSAGCGKFLMAERHTVTNEIRAVYLPGAPPSSAEGTQA